MVSVVFFVVTFLMVGGLAYRLGNMKGYVNGYRQACNFERKRRLKTRIENNQYVSMEAAEQFYEEYYGYVFKILTDPKCIAPLSVYLETLAHFEEIEEYEKCAALKKRMEELMKEDDIQIDKKENDDSKPQQGELF